MTDSSREPQVSSRSLTLRLVGFGIAMFGFGVFALPPLYDVFCEITGLGGKTGQRAAENVVVAADVNRNIALEFVTTVNQYAPWDFAASTPGMTVHPGGLYEATFVATNRSDQARIAQAVPSVAPAEAAKFFKKLECFCFSAQEFAANETKEMPVRFVIGSDLPEYIDTITLSYTFFDAAGFAEPLTQADPGKPDPGKQDGR